MENKHGFTNPTLIKLKRLHKKDVSILLKELSDKDVEINKLKDEIAYLTNKQFDIQEQQKTYTENPNTKDTKNFNNSKEKLNTIHSDAIDQQNWVNIFLQMKPRGVDLGERLI